MEFQEFVHCLIPSVYVFIKLPYIQICLLCPALTMNGQYSYALLLPALLTYVWVNSFPLEHTHNNAS